MALQVKWGRCEGDVWCGLISVNLDHATFGVGGVYVIWHGGDNPKTVYVGQGDPIRDRLAFHKENPKVTAFRQHGLCVTWAVVDGRQRGGVEHFLENRLRPLVGEAHPVATPMEVNLPW